MLSDFLNLDGFSNASWFKIQFRHIVRKLSLSQSRSTLSAAIIIIPGECTLHPFKTIVLFNGHSMPIITMICHSFLWLTEILECALHLKAAAFHLSFDE